MKKTRILTILVLSLALCSVQVSRAAPIGTAFTYQGWLMDKNNPADGAYDFKFELFDDPCTGSPQGGTIDINDLEVSGGHFTVELDFGSGVFAGDARWLSIAVRKTGSGDPYTGLEPRQELTLSPYAIYAQTAGSVPGSITGTGTANYVPVFTDANTLADSVIYQNTNNIGIGTTNPVEVLDVDGAVKLSDTANTNVGSIRWTGTDFEGYDGTKWISLTSGGTGSGVPSGAIMMWSGTIASIPVGWALCDGDMHAGKQTPNLRDRFVVGARQDDGGVAKTNIKGTLMVTGGEHEHTLTIPEMPKHNHTYYRHARHCHFSGSTTCSVSDNLETCTTEDTGGDQPHENCPPFYALAFIMRL